MLLKYGDPSRSLNCKVMNCIPDMHGTGSTTSSQTIVSMHTHPRMFLEPTETSKTKRSGLEGREIYSHRTDFASTYMPNG